MNRRLFDYLFYLYELLTDQVLDKRSLTSKALVKGFMIVDDSFSRLTTRMIVHDSSGRLNHHRLSRTVCPMIKAEGA